MIACASDESGDVDRTCGAWLAFDTEATCDPSSDAYEQCDLPHSTFDNSGGRRRVTYYSHPQCVDGLCQFCRTTSDVEDPNLTGAP